VVINPKLEKVQEKFAALLKDTEVKWSVIPRLTRNPVSNPDSGFRLKAGMTIT
jgi:hypothetical protein